jgi:hypothetical protein
MTPGQDRHLGDEQQPSNRHAAAQALYPGGSQYKAKHPAILEGKGGAPAVPSARIPTSTRERVRACTVTALGELRDRSASPLTRLPQRPWPCPQGHDTPHRQTHSGSSSAIPSPRAHSSGPDTSMMARRFSTFPNSACRLSSARRSAAGALPRARACSMHRGGEALSCAVLCVAPQFRRDELDQPAGRAGARPYRPAFTPAGAA